MSEYVKVLPDTDPALRAKSVSVRTPLGKKDQETIEGLLKYVVDSRDEELAEKYGLQAAVGLAAPQIGVNRAMIAVVIDEEQKDGTYVERRFALANPEIISHSVQASYLEAGEGCLSVKEPHKGFVPRHARITVKAYDCLEKKKVEIRAKGYLAIVLQHEIDHLSGVLYYDHINPVNPYTEIPDAIVIE